MIPVLPWLMFVPRLLDFNFALSMHPRLAIGLSLTRLSLQWTTLVSSGGSIYSTLKQTPESRQADLSIYR